MWCRATILGPDGTALGISEIGGDGDPGLDAVDAVARLVLDARRRHHTVVFGDVVAPLRDLLELAGLRVEVQRQTECREQPVVVEEREEEVHRRDPTV